MGPSATDRADAKPIEITPDEECRLGIGGSDTRAGGPAGSQHGFRLVYLEYPTWPTSERGGGRHCTGMSPHPTLISVLTAGFPPSADLGSTSLLFILSGSKGIKLEPRGPRFTRRSLTSPNGHSRKKAGRCREDLHTLNQRRRQRGIHRPKG